MMNNNIIFYDNNACVRRTSISHLNVVYRPQDIKSNYHGFLYLLGKTSSLEVHGNYFILSSLPPDTEFTFQVCKKIPQSLLTYRMGTTSDQPKHFSALFVFKVFALTSKGRGEAAILTTATDDLGWVEKKLMILIKNWWLFNNNNLVKELHGSVLKFLTFTLVPTIFSILNILVNYFIFYFIVCIATTHPSLSIIQY